MITKETALATLAEIGEHQVLSESEVVAAYHQGVDKKPLNVRHRQSNLSVIFYVLGAAVIVLGAGILTVGYWSNLSEITHILVTLGVAVAAYCMAMLFTQYTTLRGVSTTLHFVAGLLFPVGLMVWLVSVGFNDGSPSVQALAALIGFVIYFVSYRVIPRNLFLLFSIVHGTWLFLSLGTFLARRSPWGGSWEYTFYFLLIVGISYMLLSQSFLKTVHNRLSGWLAVIGSAAFLGSALVLGGWAPNENIPWQLVFPLLAFGVMYLSIARRTRTFLFVGALFLMAYVTKLSIEYFSDTTVWPFALMLAGLVLIGLGYLSIRLNEKYIKGSQL